MDGELVGCPVLALAEVPFDFAWPNWFHLPKGAGRVQHMYLWPEAAVLDLMDATVFKVSDEPTTLDLASADSSEDAAAISM